MATDIDRTSVQPVSRPSLVVRRAPPDNSSEMPVGGAGSPRSGAPGKIGRQAHLANRSAEAQTRHQMHPRHEPVSRVRRGIGWIGRYEIPAQAQLPPKPGTAQPGKYKRRMLPTADTWHDEYAVHVRRGARPCAPIASAILDLNQAERPSGEP